MTIPTEPHTRLHGRWLLVARLAWVTGFIVLTVMYGLGFLAVRETLSTVCEEEPCTLRQQIRRADAGEQVVGWPGPPVGYADRLRPDQVEALEKLGLTLDQYGWLAALQLGIPALVLLLIAACLFWWKSDHWMVLFASVMVATFPLHNTPLPFTLEVRQPAWEWVFDAVGMVALSCLLIFPLIFPTGRFVPRWTRWMALYEFAGAVLVTYFGNAILAVSGRAFIGVVLLLPSFGVGVYAQLYRYFRVARPAERQQFKWVVVGLVGFVVTQLAVLIPLNALLTSPAVSADPARALVLSAIPDTLWQLNNLLIAITITISVLRYRLWDIDLIISRTLVYGALTATVIGLYVLIVGGLSIVLQTQNNLPGIVIAILVITFLLQPLRQRLQSFANRFVPVPLVTAQAQRENESTIPERPADTKFHGRWLLIARVTWVALTILTVGLFVAAIPGYASEISDYARAGRNTVAPAWDVVLYVGGSVASIVSALLCLFLAILLVWRKPSERMAVFVSCYLLLFGAVLGGSLERTVVLWPAWGVQASAYAKPLLFATPTIALLALFPSGKFVPRLTRWLTFFSILLIPAIFHLPPYWWPDVRPPLASMIAITWAIILLAGLYAQIYRYRRISNSTERQQTKWVVFGFFLWLLLVTVVSGSYSISYGSTPFSPHPWWAPVVRAIWFLSSTILPISLTIAVMHYRLFDIDLLINRSVVYLTLTAFVVGIYVLVVGYLGVLFRTGNNLAISLIATGLVAVVFQPLRQRLQRGINRLMYGERDEPYAALSRLGRRLEASLAPEAVLPTVVTTVREALNLPYTAIYLKENNHGNKIVAESASPSLRVEGGRIRVPGMEREGLCVPLIHQGETLGYIVLGPRAPNEAFSSTDLRLLDDLVPQVGVAVHAVRLTADLQHSRERLVTAREEERRRLRRDLHDGLGPQLAGLALKLETLRNRLKGDPLADSLLADLAKRTQDATADIRHLVYELRPPTLDELGLASALRESVAQFTQQGCNDLNIAFDAPESLPSLPAAVEVAVYRIAQEALTNIIRHADARACLIRLKLDTSAGLLCLEVQDNGKGLLMKRRAGVGLNSMRERAEELGGTWTIESNPTGGTRILARLPCRLSDEPASSTREEK